MAARNGAKGPRERPRTRRSERRPAKMASRELHVVTLRALIMILSADMTMVQHLPMQVSRKVFPLVIREPCVQQQTSSERSYLDKYSTPIHLVFY